MIRGVVDALKLVKIEHNETETVLSLPTISDELLILDVEGSHVAKASQLIGKTQKLELVVRGAQTIGHQFKAIDRMQTSEKLMITDAMVDEVVGSGCQHLIEIETIVLFFALAVEDDSGMPIVFELSYKLAKIKGSLTQVIAIYQHDIGVFVLKDFENLSRGFGKMDGIYRQREIWVIMEAGRHEKSRDRPSTFLSGLGDQYFHCALLWSFHDFWLP